MKRIVIALVGLCLVLTACEKGSVINSLSTLLSRDKVPISDCISCTVVNGENQLTVPLHTRYVNAYTNGTSGMLTGDGLLAFAPLEEYIKLSKNPEIPKIKKETDFAINVCFDPSVQEKVQNRKIYNMEDGFALIDNVDDYNLLSPGQYLIDVNCYVSRGKEYYSGDVLIVINVAGK